MVDLVEAKVEDLKLAQAGKQTSPNLEIQNQNFHLQFTRIAYYTLANRL